MTRAATVREYYELVDANEYAELVALFAPDVVYERPGQPPLEGREELLAFYREGRPLEEGSHTIHAVVPDGDTVAVRGTYSGLQGGETVEFGFADFHQFEDGLIARRHTFTDRDEV